MTHTYPKGEGAGMCDQPAKFVQRDGKEMLIYCAEGHLIRPRQFVSEERAQEAVNRQSQVLTLVTGEG